MAARIVLDTNVFVSALAGAQGASRQVIRLCLQRQCQPLMGAKLFLEYEDVMARSEPFAASPLSAVERQRLLAAFASVCEWTKVYFLWRPNLQDEHDNHVLELAVAGGATAIVTHNVRDFQRSELRFPEIAVLRPGEFLKQMR